MSDEKATGRRTIRRYAHELYPHPEEGEARALEVDVRYTIARAIGSGIGREWHDLIDEGGESARQAAERTMQHLTLCDIAFLAVALHEGLAGQDAWDRARSYAGDECDEILWEIAERYGIDPDAIKPYVIREEPSTHEHWSERDARGFRTLLEHRVEGKESECLVCTEPDDTPIVPVVIPRALVRHRLERGIFICEGGARSECHVYPDCECERWYHDEETDKHPHPSVPHATCWMLDWLNNSDPRDTMLEDGGIDFGELLDGEVLVEWNGEDAVLWHYGSIGASA